MWSAQPSLTQEASRPVSASDSPDTIPAPRLVPELLAPAGDWECAKAAVENGADAIYFGLEKFNARMRARNFTETDLPELLQFLHRRGVKAYVTFNTLVFQNELSEAEQYLRAIISAGVDAAIVQDVGICRLIRRLSPDFPIHASTQMTITSASGVEFARELGCNLVVLARECSIKEIEKIWGERSVDSLVRPHQTSDEGTGGQGCPRSVLAQAPSPPVTRHSSLPLEVFVHGALCVAYSGQCLTSEALGGRSANRGECAQACRLPYELVADGKQVSLGDRKYLLSPQDLAGLDLLPELVRAGVASLKIEGRLKSAEYVANITRIYRKALDELANGTQNTEHGTRATHRDSPIPDRTSSRYEMEMSFSRGLDTGWLGGIDNQKLVHGRFGKKRGVYLGEVAEVQGEGVFAYLEASLKPGDGVVFDAGQPEQKEEGGRVYGIKPIRGRRPLVHHVERIPLLLSFGRGAVDFSRVHPGDKIWKTSDPQLDRQLRQSFQAETPQFQRPLTLEVHGFAGSPLTVIACDELGHAVKLASEIALTAARNQPLTTERLREQLGRLGGTPFRLGELKNRLEGELLLPVRELNRLRREVVRQLEGLRAQRKRWTILSQASRLPEVRLPSSASLAPQLLVLVRNLPQLDATLQSRIQTIYCEFEDPKKYRDAVTAFRNSAFRTPHSAIFVAPPRIFKTGEEWILKQVRSCEADGYLIRNYDHLRYFANDRCVGDFSLNIANSLAADYFKNKFGLERVTASYDLNALQLEALLEAAPPEWFEVTIHQHMPMFHMEHCVFCAFLSTGTDYRNCGRPCDNHQLKLRDRVGAEHPIKADVGCRNTVFNSRAQSGADCVAPLLELGLRHFRLEFLNETPDQVAQTIASYQKLLGGEITSAQLWREVKALNQLGVTRPPDR